MRRLYGLIGVMCLGGCAWGTHFTASAATSSSQLKLAAQPFTGAVPQLADVSVSTETVDLEAYFDVAVVQVIVGAAVGELTLHESTATRAGEVTGFDDRYYAGVGLPLRVHGATVMPFATYGFGLYGPLVNSGEDDGSGPTGSSVDRSLEAGVEVSFPMMGSMSPSLRASYIRQSGKAEAAIDRDNLVGGDYSVSGFLIAFGIRAL